MDEYVKFNNQTTGRDKMFRFVQYTSKLVWYTLHKKGSLTGAERAKRIDESLGLMRRILRFGRFFETLHSAIPVMSTISDHVVRMTSALSRISSSCFMLIDHIVCLDKIGILPPRAIDAKKWDLLSTKFWLYSILLGLIRDIYEIMRIYKEEYHKRFGRTSSKETESKVFPKGENHHMVICISKARVVTKCIKDHPDVAVDSLKNLCDLFLPLNSLGFISLNSGIVGILGIVSTIASIFPQINPMIKMVPAT